MVAPAQRAILLVDGYNVIGAWTSLKQIRDRDGLEPARHQLAQTLLDYSAFQGYATHLVFDAQYQNGSGKWEKITPDLAIYYTQFGQTADTYIEKFCASARQLQYNLQQRLIVATSDRAQQLMVLGYGAEWMSAQLLAQEVRATRFLIGHKRQSGKKTSSRAYLANSLDPSAKQRLERLRTGLDM